jgi:hypothetical protein
MRARQTIDDLREGGTQQSRFGLSLIGLFAGLAAHTCTTWTSINGYGPVARKPWDKRCDLFRDHYGVTCSARTAFDGHGCFPFDFRSVLRNAVGIDEHDLPDSAHGDGRDLFFESFQPPRKIFADHFVSPISSAAIAEALRQLSAVARISAHGKFDLKTSGLLLGRINEHDVDDDGLCVWRYLFFEFFEVPHLSVHGFRSLSAVASMARQYFLNPLQNLISVRLWHRLPVRVGS